MTTDQIAAVWPTAEELGFPDEQACFGLQFGHGLGVGLYEAPMISRLHSLEHPIDDRAGDGLRARDLLRGQRRPLGGAHRGGGRRHRRRQPRSSPSSRPRSCSSAARPTCAAPTCCARARCVRLMAATTTTHRADRRRRRAPARPVPPHAPHPPLRGRGPVALPEGRGARHDAPLLRPGGVGRSASAARSATAIAWPAPIAATATRWRSAPRRRGCSTSCSAARPASAAGRAGSMNVIDLEHRPDRLLRDRRRLHRGGDGRVAGASAARAASPSPTSATAPPTRPTSTSA